MASRTLGFVLTLVLFIYNFLGGYISTFTKWLILPLVRGYLDIGGPAYRRFWFWQNTQMCVDGFTPGADMEIQFAVPYGSGECEFNQHPFPFLELDFLTRVTGMFGSNNSFYICCYTHDFFVG